MTRWSDAPVMEAPVKDEDPADRKRRLARNKAARESWSRRASELCARCGQVRLNVIHEDDRRNAPEGLAYYADVPFCDFQPSGRYWR